MGAHARLGPSNKRWPKCAGSVREEAAYPDTSSDAAIDGTGSHLLLELCLVNGVKADTYIGQTIGVGDAEMPMGWFVEADRAKRVQICLDYVSQRVAELKAEYGVQYSDVKVAVEAETISNAGEAYGRDDWWGTCDITLVVMARNSDDELHEAVFVEVIDYKDGRRYVDEKFNTQLMTYLHGKTYALISCISGAMTIVQPKTKVAIRTHHMTLADLQKEADKLAVAAAKTDASDAPLTAGKHCHDFCKHKPNCQEFKNQKFGRINVVEEMGLVEKVTNHLQTMQGHELSAILDVEKDYTKAFKEAKEEAIRRINSGHTVPNYIVGNGSNKYVWAEDEEEMIKKFKGRKLTQADYYVSKLISPAQVEKMTEKLSETQIKGLQKFVKTVEGNPSLKRTKAPEKQTAEQMFGGQVEQPLTFLS